MAIKEEYENIDGKAISNAINDLVNKILIVGNYGCYIFRWEDF